MHDAIVRQLQRHEGLRLTPYRCTAGKLTIGYGRNLDDVGISEQEALEMLRHDVSNATQLCRATLYNFDKLNEARQGVIINMVFNLGWHGFSKFKKTIRYVNDEDYTNAAQEMLDSKWAKQVGDRALELSEQMKAGKYRG